MEKITLYHATERLNCPAISTQGLKAGIDGYCYFCLTPKDCCRYATLKNPGCTETYIIPIEFTKEEFESMEKNIDNNPDYTPDAYKGNISADRIDINKVEGWTWK